MRIDATKLLIVLLAYTASGIFEQTLHAQTRTWPMNGVWMVGLVPSRVGNGLQCILAMEDRRTSPIRGIGISFQNSKLSIALIDGISSLEADKILAIKFDGKDFGTFSVDGYVVNPLSISTVGATIPISMQRDFFKKFIEGKSLEISDTDTKFSAPLPGNKQSIDDLFDCSSQVSSPN